MCLLFVHMVSNPAARLLRTSRRCLDSSNFLISSKSPQFCISGMQSSAARVLATMLSSEQATDEGREIILVSGGVESSTLLHQVCKAEEKRKKNGFKPMALFFDYGQRGVEGERRAVHRQCDVLGLERAFEIDLRQLGMNLRARQGSERRHVPLLHRNGILLTIAASVAAQEQGRGIWIALSKDDVTWYPSASISFINAMKHALQQLDERFELHAPLMNLQKSEVIELGLSQGVDFSTTWSCMLGHDRHCGRCVQCKSRKAAFQQCEVPEPSEFYQR